MNGSNCWDGLHKHNKITNFLVPFHHIHVKYWNQSNIFLLTTSKIIPTKASNNLWYNRNKIIDPSVNYLYKGDAIFKFHALNMYLLHGNKPSHHCKCLAWCLSTSFKPKLSYQELVSSCCLEGNILRNERSPCILFQHRRCDLIYAFILVYTLLPLRKLMVELIHIIYDIYFTCLKNGESLLCYVLL